eukprot:TRINITY_DN11069_c0_g1_i1.p1 TRINITY_DN11069_c0_g1~~TRINITY_DN11069_c0_g1_i1.p1  ORF type:complete len:1275 (+),score=341.62 TRINITY_DN11069_c0_g1_i1:86-3826(+)
MSDAALVSRFWTIHSALATEESCVSPPAPVWPIPPRPPPRQPRPRQYTDSSPEPDEFVDPRQSHGPPSPRGISTVRPDGLSDSGWGNVSVPSDASTGRARAVQSVLRVTEEYFEEKDRRRAEERRARILRGGPKSALSDSISSAVSTERGRVVTAVLRTTDKYFESKQPKRGRPAGTAAERRRLQWKPPKKTRSLSSGLQRRKLQRLALPFYRVQAEEWQRRTGVLRQEFQLRSVMEAAARAAFAVSAQVSVVSLSPRVRTLPTTEFFTVLDCGDSYSEGRETDSKKLLPDGVESAHDFFEPDLCQLEAAKADLAALLIDAQSCVARLSARCSINEPEKVPPPPPPQVSPERVPYALCGPTNSRSRLVNAGTAADAQAPAPASAPAPAPEPTLFPTSPILLTSPSVGPVTTTAGSSAVVPSTVGTSARLTCEYLCWRRPGAAHSCELSLRMGLQSSPQPLKRWEVHYDAAPAAAAAASPTHQRLAKLGSRATVTLTGGTADARTGRATLRLPSSGPVRVAWFVSACRPRRPPSAGSRLVVRRRRQNVSRCRSRVFMTDLPGATDDPVDGDAGMARRLMQALSRAEHERTRAARKSDSAEETEPSPSASPRAELDEREPSDARRTSDPLWPAGQPSPARQAPVSPHEQPQDGPEVPGAKSPDMRTHGRIPSASRRLSQFSLTESRGSTCSIPEIHSLTPPGSPRKSSPRQRRRREHTSTTDRSGGRRRRGSGRTSHSTLLAPRGTDQRADASHDPPKPATTTQAPTEEKAPPPEGKAPPPICSCCKVNAATHHCGECMLDVCNSCQLATHSAPPLLDHDVRPLCDWESVSSVATPHAEALAPLAGRQSFGAADGTASAPGSHRSSLAADGAAAAAGPPAGPIMREASRDSDGRRSSGSRSDRVVQRITRRGSVSPDLAVTGIGRRLLSEEDPGASEGHFDLSASASDEHMDGQGKDGSLESPPGAKHGLEAAAPASQDHLRASLNATISISPAGSSSNGTKLHRLHHDDVSTQPVTPNVRRRPPGAEQAETGRVQQEEAAGQLMGRMASAAESSAAGGSDVSTRRVHHDDGALHGLRGRKSSAAESSSGTGASEVSSRRMQQHDDSHALRDWMEAEPTGSDASIPTRGGRRRSHGSAEEAVPSPRRRRSTVVTVDDSVFGAREPSGHQLIDVTPQQTANRSIPQTQSQYTDRHPATVPASGRIARLREQAQQREQAGTVAAAADINQRIDRLLQELDDVDRAGRAFV